jgi:hypothetical protein
MPGAPVRSPAIDPARLVAAAVRAPFALFWGPACVLRRTAHSFFWGAQPECRPCPAPMHIYRIACEPPCYGGCGCNCGCRHG